MIFVFIEDGSLEIVSSIEEATKEYEGIDVESGVFKFYDKNGVYLKPVFSSPNNISSLFFGLFKTATSGVYTLVPAANEEEDTINDMLWETITLNNNEYFKSLDEIKIKFNCNT